jgi:hypothetical protein
MSKIVGILSIVSLAVFAMVGFADAAALNVTNDNPAIGNEIRFFGECDVGAGGNVQIAVVQGATTTVIGHATTETDGVFSGTLTLPEGLAVGNAQLQASCPDGVVVAAALTLTPDNDVAVPTPTPSSTTGAAGAAGTAVGAADTTPSGGVAAGGSNLGLILGAILAVLGGLGAVVSRRMQGYSHEA